MLKKDLLVQKRIYTLLHPTAGYIPNLGGGAESGQLTTSEKEYLRTLAKKVKEIADYPKQEEKRNLWYRHNKLEKVRPMVLVFPEDSWIEVIGEDELKVKDPFWKQWEWYLRHLIYRERNIVDDFVIEPDLYVTLVVNRGSWGVDSQSIRPEYFKGAWKNVPPLKNPEDIKKLRYPAIEIDEKATQKRFDAVNAVFGDTLPVHIHCDSIYVDLIGEACSLRGIEQVMLDMYDRPQWLHEMMNFMAEGVLRQAKFLEENSYLNLNNRNHYTDSGGIGYTDELPSEDFDSKHVRLCDQWGFGAAQEMSEVGPEQHEEFVLNYQLRILEQYGLNAYGCCESYANKLDMLKSRIPRLRRISISPWCNIEKAAGKLEDKYIFSWKPNPAMLVGNFNPEKIRAYIRRTLEVAKDCVLEIILKDTFTIENEPERLKIWARITREEIEKMWG